MERTNLNLIDLALMQQVKESMSIVDAVLEPVDNGFDSVGIKNIFIDLDKENKTFTVVTDGVPMTEDKMNEFCSKYISHLCTDETQTIGLMGKGAKMAAIRIGDTKKGTELEIISKHKGGTYKYPFKQTIYFKESEKNDCMTRGDLIPIVKNEEIRSLKYGMTYRVKNCLDELYSDENINMIKKVISETYGFNHFISKVNIFFNGEEIEYKDYMKLNILGNNINTDGLYNIDGLWFKVFTHTFKNINDLSKELKFKTISLYTPRPSDKDMPKDSTGNLSRVGIYTFRGHRLMDKGGNIAKMFGQGAMGSANTGGANRCRLAIITDDDVHNLLDIQANKSQGIKGFVTNPNIYAHYKNDEGFTPLEVIKTDFNGIMELNKYECKGYQKTKKYNPITKDEVVKYLYKPTEKIDVKNTKTGGIKIPSAKSIKTVDTAPTNIIDDIIATNNVDPQTKAILYILKDNLEKQKVAVTKIEKVIKGFYEGYKKHYKHGAETDYYNNCESRVG